MNIALLSAIRQSGLKQWELAQKARITESSLSRLLNERPMTVKHTARLKSAIAAALKRSVVDLFEVTGGRNENDPPFQKTSNA